MASLIRSSSLDSLKIGVIAGVIAAVVVILVSVIGFAFWRRSRRPKAILSGRESGVLANEIAPQAHVTHFPALSALGAISSTNTRDHAEKFPVAPIGGNRDDLLPPGEREIARGPASITSSLGPYSEPRNAASGSLSSPSMRGRRRLLPPPPDGDSSTALPLIDTPPQPSPRPSAQELPVQIPDSEVDRILEIIASRIDVPGNLTYPPPYRR